MFEQSKFIHFTSQYFFKLTCQILKETKPGTNCKDNSNRLALPSSRDVGETSKLKKPFAASRYPKLHTHSGLSGF